jgi:hypothetical protein
MCSEQLLRHLEDLVVDSRFRAMSALDLQNILTAIDLCGIGFNRGTKVAEDLNLLLADEWPATHSESAIAKYRFL